MNEPDKMLALVSEALNYFDDSNFQLSKIMRKAIHIANLRNDYENLFWLKAEMINVNKDTLTVLGKEFGESFPSSKVQYLMEIYLKERKIKEVDENSNHEDKGNFIDKSIPGIEELINTFTREAEILIPPKNKDISYLLTIEKSDFKRRTQLTATVSELRGILNRIENRVHEFLSVTEKHLLYSQINSAIFEKYRKYVDLKLSAIAPETLEQFTIAYKRLNEENSEARSHALLSCRRILKSFTDHIYPVPKEPVIGHDGKVRDLTDDKYIARLWQYIADKAKGTASGDLLLVQTNDLGNRLDRIYKLTNKGTHADVSEFEVNQCVIQTYLLIGDILFLDDKYKK